MKRLIAMLLAAAMLSVPVYGEDSGYTQEELILRAKEICDIGEYEGFDVENISAADDVTIYGFNWYDENNKRSVYVYIDSNGVIYSYDDYSQDENISKSKIYNKTESKAVADSFLKECLGNEAKKLVYKDSSSSSYNSTYSFYYVMSDNGIEIDGADIIVRVDKYTNKVISYSYSPRLNSLKIAGFDNTRSIEEAEQTVKDNFDLGYIINYNLDDNKDELLLIYDPENYRLKETDLMPVTYNDLYTSETEEAYSAADVGGGGSAKVRELTEEEQKGLLNLNKAVSFEKALEVYNYVFNDNMTSNDVTYKYRKEDIDKDTYYINVTKTEDGITKSFNVDSKGRLTYFDTYKTTYEENKTENTITEEDVRPVIEDVIERANSSEFKLTPVEISENKYYEGMYNASAYVIRNGYKSFDEEIYVRTNTEGQIIYFSAYYDDEIFVGKLPKAVITPEEAFNNAKEKLGFKPYYTITENYNNDTGKYTYDTIPVYGFDDDFTVNAVTGEVLSNNGSKIKEEIDAYTDLTNQWYAESAKYLMYMGYSFDGDEFKGDEVLTYDAMTDLYDSLEITDEEIAPDTVITRYDFGKRLVKAMGYEDLSKYNEIYIKPFDDVDFEYTGVVAILKAKGILTDDSYRGSDPITRGEAAVMLYRYLSSK